MYKPKHLNLNGLIAKTLKRVQNKKVYKYSWAIKYFMNDI